jgi:serine/threonine-protein kinase SRPK3
MYSVCSLLPKLLLNAKGIPPRVQAVEEPLGEYRPGGYHPVGLGDTFDGDRFSVIRKLGWGQYSTVWLAKDARSVFFLSSWKSITLLMGSRDNRYVALKILTDSSTAALSFDEVGFLTRVNEATPTHPGRKHVVLMKHHFKHVGPNGTHICIAFEMLGPSIREIQRLFRGSGLPQIFVKRVATQTLLALDFLQRSCGIIHSGALSPSFPMAFMLRFTDKSRGL